MHLTHLRFVSKISFVCLFFSLNACAQKQIIESEIPHQQLRITSLKQLSIEQLRQREYGSTIIPIKLLSDTKTKNSYTEHFFTDKSQYHSVISQYQSDGLTLFSRIDIPTTPMPNEGYPVVIFVHGWVGEAKAPSYNFNYDTSSQYAEIIDELVKKGFIVLTPGLRGHGTVNKKAADGIEYLSTWDNGSYINPIYYGIDVLNLLDSVDSISTIDWSGISENITPVKVNTQYINIFGHSQGGDAILTALAVSGEGSKVRIPLNSGAIWAGCFLPRIEQAKLYGPMGSSTQAFLAGDNTWTGTATGKDGSINPNFVFGFPPDWIGSPDNKNNQWTWQQKTWPLASVEDSLIVKFDQMYQTINKYVDDTNDASYQVEQSANGKVTIKHDKKLQKSISALDAYSLPQYLLEPIALHHSDQDYYSPSKWNEDLAKTILTSGGQVFDYEYKHTTHSLTPSKHLWFSPKGTESGVASMMERTISLFNNSYNKTNGKASKKERHD